MDSTNHSENPSVAFEETHTRNPNLEFCYPFSKTYPQNEIPPTFSIVMAVWNILLAVSVILLNILVFTAVRRNNSLRLPSKILFLGLISTDLGTGAVAQPQFAALLFAMTTSSPRTTCFLVQSFSMTTSIFSTASLATMTAISLDRFAACFYHLKYKEIVTTKRVCILLAISWSYSLVFASAFQWDIYLHQYLLISNLIFPLTITVVYIKIYRGLRQHHGHQVQDQAQAQAEATALDVAKYRRTASSMMWIYGLFLLCYVPHFCVFLLRTYLFNNSVVTMVLYNLSIILMLLNSSLNPLVYCFRLPEIRAEVIRTVLKILRQNR